ncbi:MAG: cbb3-type cytochrome c oxidase subunit 3 [Phenylobacterium sp.]|uniref:cbb3-type cytochrome c oxidase subunit 3 n=1 Tax=Phenylobacterium sp. TaxID=1871053 RepID=UPI0025CBEDFF|nr:cbb3-type cytochrome c oxidase subunit 3 [Phenylobacterium sp.]MCA6334423.1 cbb3-type cytochrome c oxidase subunit 3 [Phenylobacterium sp.]
MNFLTYEQVARFAQQGGTVYFVVIFLAGIVYALWPKNREAFRDMAHLPLRDDEDEHVGS